MRKRLIIIPLTLLSWSRYFISVSIHVPRAGYDPSGIPNQVTVTDISIHVPRAGYDGRRRLHLPRPRYFYPRTPCGVRHVTHDRLGLYDIFLSTYPVRGTTGHGRGFSCLDSISIHVPRAGYDPALLTRPPKRQNFYPRTPCGVRQQSVTNQTICFVYLPKAIEAPGKCFSIFPLKWHIMPTNPVRRCLGFRESLTFALEY